MPPMPFPLSRRQFLRATGAATLATAWGPHLARGADVGRAGPGGGANAAADGAAADSLAGPSRGPWRRLFLDATTVEASGGLARVFHSAVKASANPVIKADRPWESGRAISGPYVYGTVFRDGNRLRLWYQVLNQGNHVGYAESLDGVVWTKPELGLIAYEGSKANNLVVSAFQPEVTGGTCHNPSVIRRHGEPDPAKQYALYGYDGAAKHPRVAWSPDGLRWRYDPATERTPLFNSADVVNFFRDPYEARYAATWKTRNRRGRAVGIAWSADGLNWTKPFDGPIFTADDLDPDATQIYGMPVFAYQGLYVGQPWIYRARYFKSGDYSVKKLHEAQADSLRTMEVQLAWSWDLMNWTRPPARDQFIPLGAPGEWDDGMIFTAGAPVVMGDKLHFYYGGCDGFHDDKRVKTAIGLATLRLDGFCSLRAGADEGWFISRREPMREPAVTINARTAPTGVIAAEILDRQNRVVPGFSREECISFSGDSVRHELTWKTARFATEASGEEWKIRFWLKDAELFSYLPRALDPGQPDLSRFQKTGP